jgi:hypothetical protein
VERVSAPKVLNISSNTLMRLQDDSPGGSMFPVSFNAVTNTNDGAFGTARVQAHVEIAYSDAASVRTFSIARAALPRLGPGDVIYLSSGGQGVYRTVTQVQPIAGDALMIFLERRGISSSANVSDVDTAEITAESPDISSAI